MLEMVFTLCSCWHHHIESVMASPLSTFESSHVTDTCNDACPHCDGTLYKFLVPIVKSGTIDFLTYTFFENFTKLLKPLELAKELYIYKGVGKKIFNRKRSLQAESTACCQIVILQLLAAKILYLHIDEDETPKAVCKLVFKDKHPNYLRDEPWKSLQLIDKNSD